MLVEAVGAQEVSMTTLFSTPPSSGRRNRGVLRTLLRCFVAIVFIAGMATVVGCPHLFAFMPADADQALSAVDRISVEQNTVDTTIEALQLLDARGQHGVVLWVGAVEGRRARVLLAVALVRDDADPAADQSLVSGETRERMNHALSQSGLWLIAEVQSRTTAIGDSSPKRHVVADSEGALALILPTRSPDADPTKWTAYRRFNGKSRSLSVGQMRKLLKVDLESVR
jgi:hypothetical protein